MTQREELDRKLKEILEKNEELFGDVEEFSENEVLDRLTTGDLDPHRLSGALYKRMQEIVAGFRAKGEPVPQRYIEAMEQARPVTERGRSLKHMEARARQWIEGFRSRAWTGDKLELVVEFRNKGKLTVKDEQILKRIEEQVRARAEREKM